MAAPVLGYWEIRGRAHSIRLLLSYAEATYAERRYTKKSDWEVDKANLDFAFPNLPYFIEDEMMLTQSSAILKYIARKHGLDGSNDCERRLIDQVFFEIIDVREQCLSLAYTNANEYASCKESLLSDYLPSKMQQLCKFLSNQAYFATETASYVDFVIYETLMLCLELEPSCLDKHENLVNFLKRIEALPNIAKFISQDAIRQLPFNAKTARFGYKEPRSPCFADAASQ